MKRWVSTIERDEKYQLILIYLRYRFADFIEGSPHLMPNEVSVHAQEYGFGGSFFEDELFNTDDEDEEEELKPMMNPKWDGGEENQRVILSENGRLGNASLRLSRQIFVFDAETWEKNLWTGFRPELSQKEPWGSD